MNLKLCVMKPLIRQSKTQLFRLLLLSTVFLTANSFTGVDFAKQAELLQQQIQRFREIQRKGGWPTINLGKNRYQKGESGPAIKQLKQRLQTSGDFPDNDTSAVYTAALETAVKRVQRRFGFPENGIVEAALVLELNVPVEERLAQLSANLQRASSQPPLTAANRIVVNIPEYKLHVYEDDREVLSVNAVVGKESTKTALFQAELTQVVFSPYWNVPPSIVENEILPAMRRNKRYLAAHRYEVTGYEDGLPVIRQRPGSNNSLGKVKFLFPNSQAIYFHDTPEKSLFKNRIRAYSHGCVRLEEPEKLAAYLLRNSPEWSPSAIDRAMNAGQERWVKLPVPLPVQITYYTAWIDDEGLLHFRDDIYHLDTSPAFARLDF